MAFDGHAPSVAPFIGHANYSAPTSDTRFEVIWDTETALIQRGLLAPPMTCMSFFDVSGRYGIVDRHTAREMLRDWLTNPVVHLTGHNTAYDSAVACAEFPELMPLFFNAYEQGRIHCTMIDEMLLDIGEGHFRWEVDPLTDMVLRRKSYELGALVPGMEKDKYRYGYGPLRDVPIHLWEQGARDYPIKDCFGTGWLRWKQTLRAGGRDVPDGAVQARNHFALQLMSCWGMRTDGERVGWLKHNLEQACDQLAGELVVRGLLREDGTRDMEAIREQLRQSGVQLVYTPSGQISTAADFVKEAAEHANDGQGDPNLHFLLQYVDHLKVLSSFVPALLDGIYLPINARFNPLVETGRTSCSKPNLQQLPRGKRTDYDLSKYVRECFVPRNGFVFVDSDYDTLEMRTLGQVLFDLCGGTTLAEHYQRDPDFDPHTNLATQIRGMSYEEGLWKKENDKEFADFRQFVKPANFAFAAAMGTKKYRAYAWKGYGIRVSMEDATFLRWQYMRSIPEIQRYFHAASSATRTGNCTIVALRSGRIRGGCRFTDTCNGFFQQLAADGAKYALWEVTKRCYVDRSSYLYGSRPVCFVHDQIITESPEQIAHECALEQQWVMERAMEVYTPNVPSRASSNVTRRWVKGAKKKKDARGRIIPYDRPLPERKAA